MKRAAWPIAFVLTAGLGTVLLFAVGAEFRREDHRMEQGFELLVESLAQFVDVLQSRTRIGSHLSELLIYMLHYLLRRLRQLLEPCDELVEAPQRSRRTRADERDLLIGMLRQVLHL